MRDNHAPSLAGVTASKGLEPFRVVEETNARTLRTIGITARAILLPDPE